MGTYRTRGLIDNHVIRLLKAWILPIALIVIACFVIIHMIHKNNEEIRSVVNESIIGREGEVKTITESELKDVVKQSKLYKIDYPYNGYVAVKNGKGDVKYYVAYKGNVKAGIDVDKIEYSIDDTNSVISIKLPKVMIEDPGVDAGSMDYIFFDEDENKEDVAQEAYKCSLSDIKKQIANDGKLVEAANKSAESTERALIEPWIDQYAEKNYEVRISIEADEK